MLLQNTIAILIGLADGPDGDWQIIRWLRKKNHLNLLSRFKIFDNLRRSLVPLFVLMLVAFSAGADLAIWSMLSIAVMSLIMPAILDIVNYVVFKKNVESSRILAYKNMVPVISGIKASITRAMLEILFLPNKVYITISSIVKALYRMGISKQNLLEWVTSEEAEKQGKTNLKSYYKSMWFNVLMGIIFVGITIANFVGAGFHARPDIGIALFLGTLWILAPIAAWYISRPYKERRPIDEINSEGKKYIMEAGARTWEFFKDFMNEENNFLIPDNYQEDRAEKIAHRTSSTNIGLRNAGCNVCI